MATKKTTPQPARPKALTVGQRVMASLIPRHFPTMTALQNASGLAFSTLSNWKRGTKSPDTASIELVARLAGVSALDLLGERRAHLASLRHHPSFAGALARAKARYPDRVPDAAYERAADTYAAQWPTEIDEHFLFNLARFWWDNAPDSEVMRAEEAEMQAEMDAIDSARKH